MIELDEFDNRDKELRKKIDTYQLPEITIKMKPIEHTIGFIKNLVDSYAVMRGDFYIGAIVYRGAYIFRPMYSRDTIGSEELIEIAHKLDELNSEVE